MACAAVVALYALCIGFLVFAIYQEDHSLNVALLILFLAGVAAAALVYAVPARWPEWAALAYALVTAVADAPHQLAEISHPSSHFPVSLFILVVTAAAIVVSAWAALGDRSVSEAQPA